MEIKCKTTYCTQKNQRERQTWGDASIALHKAWVSRWRHNTPVWVKAMRVVGWEPSCGIKPSAFRSTLGMFGTKHHDSGEAVQCGSCLNWVHTCLYSILLLLSSDDALTNVFVAWGAQKPATKKVSSALVAWCSWGELVLCSVETLRQ